MITPKASVRKESKTKLVLEVIRAIPPTENKFSALILLSFHIIPLPKLKFMLYRPFPMVNAPKGKANPNSGLIHEPVPSKPPRANWKLSLRETEYLNVPTMGVPSQVVITPTPILSER